MCKALTEIEEYGIECGIERGIQSIIKLCQEFGISTEKTIQKIMDDFSFSKDKANEYIQKYWI